MNKNLKENLISQMNAENDTMKRKKLLVKIKTIDPQFMENDVLANNMQTDLPVKREISNIQNPVPEPEISIKEITMEEPIGLTPFLEKETGFKKWWS